VAWSQVSKNPLKNWPPHLGIIGLPVACGLWPVGSGHPGPVRSAAQSHGAGYPRAPLVLGPDPRPRHPPTSFNEQRATSPTPSPQTQRGMGSRGSEAAPPPLPPLSPRQCQASPSPQPLYCLLRDVNNNNQEPMRGPSACGIVEYHASTSNSVHLID
jgi:hypothetical protein